MDKWDEGLAFILRHGMNVLEKISIHNLPHNSNAINTLIEQCPRLTNAQIVENIIPRGSSSPSQIYIQHLDRIVSETQIESHTKVYIISPITP
jgi:hypothetical protein